MIKKIKNKNIYYQGPISDHFDGYQFFNYWERQKFHSFFDIFKWRFTSKKSNWPTNKIITHQDKPPSRVQGDSLRVSFVGHSTMLVQTANLNILTDPVWSKRASPFGFLGPKRYTKPGVNLHDLPPIDIILISHNHYDHLDIATLKKLSKKDPPLVITPLGNDNIIKKNIPSLEVVALDWHEKTAFKNTSIHLIPTQHWSARGLFDQNMALWGGFVIAPPETGNIFFCGDSGYNESLFKEALIKFKSFRFAMLPIGAYEPRWLMKYAHMSPEEAFLAYDDLGKPYTAAIHFETFRLTDEGFLDPREYIQSRHSISKDNLNFKSLKVGESWEIPKNGIK